MPAAPRWPPAWDTDLARKIGEGLGRDARARSVNFLLGPGVNIARSPISGRNFEYLSEDPFLNAALVVPFIEGVQSQGVIATVKHYALNDQEFNRHNASADVDERTMREIYLPAFEAAVTKAHVDAVMNSYNLVNGVHSTQNDFLNLKVLKGEWGFPGRSHVRLGRDLRRRRRLQQRPRSRNAQPQIHEREKSDSRGPDRPGQRVHHRRARSASPPRPSCATASPRARNSIPPTPPIRSPIAPLALEGALESITLLKNEGNLLPLDPAKIKNIAIIGPDAYPAVTGGGGSSEAHAFEPVSILTGIANLLGPDAHVFYSPAMPDAPDEKKAVAQADVVIVVCRLQRGHGARGRTTAPSRCLPGQDALIEQVAAANPHTIVVLTGGGGMDTSRWLDKVPVLLHTWYPGQEGGTAVAQILFGQHNPEGKLPVSFDRSWDENPSAKWYHGDPKNNTTLHTTGADGQPKDYTVEHIQYGDKLMVGYRYWTTTGKHPLFPFGFGLSYTTFKFANLSVPPQRLRLPGRRQLRRHQYRQRRRR